MAKRFTDTDKWKKGFYKKITNLKYKLLWLYILDDCNHVEYGTLTLSGTL